MIPIQITVVRYVCPFCRTGRSTGKASLAHIARCWRNPAVRGCKTCKHFSPADDESPESCCDGVDLTTRPCPLCEGRAEAWVDCGHCNGSGEDPDTATKPVVGCDLWEAKS